MSTRQEKVKEFLKIEVSNIILKEIRDPRLGFVTVTGADVSKDLRHATIFISVMGDDEQRQDSIAILQKASGFIRSEFGRKSTMKLIPQISFKLDTAVEHGVRIFELLQQVKHEPEKPDNSSDS
jgi:ribosome-binding factor A